MIKWEEISISEIEDSQESIEDIEQRERCFLEYSALDKAYEIIIDLEKDTDRREMLKAMAADLHEENK